VRIAILGAPRTGKSQIAEAICKHLKTQGYSVTFIDDSQHAWRDNEPQLSENHLMVIEVHARTLLDNECMDTQARDWKLLFDITLLMGLDLPRAPNGIQGNGAHVHELVDQKIRHMLTTAGVHYQVIYGHGIQRLENALHCIASAAARLTHPMAAHLSQTLIRPETLPKWTGPCETCGDGACEHRLFTRLLK
jgi:hypothetical protein